MKVKTYTALITVAVDDDEKLPETHTIEERIQIVLETKQLSVYKKMDAAFVSVSEGDNVVDPDAPSVWAFYHSARTNALGQVGMSLVQQKQQHQTLRLRGAGALPIEPPSINEGSDTD